MKRKAMYRMLTVRLVLSLSLQAVGKDCAYGSGTTGADVLKLSVGARAMGMGEAYTAQADDVSSLYWNPAGIAYLNQSQASFMYNPIFKDLSFQNASVGIPLENGALGASVSYLSYGDIVASDELGNPAGSISAYSGVATLGGAWLGNNWSAGFNLKGIQQSLADEKANAFAGDVGASVVYPREVGGGTLRAAASIRNLGPGIKFINQSDPLPRQWRIGVAAVQLMKSKLNLSMDYGKERDLRGAVYAGTEYWFMPFVALRAGYAGSDVEGNGIRAGLGLKFKNVSFDYAFSKYGDLGFAHLYELTLRFGVIQPRLTAEQRALLHQAKVAMAHERYGEATAILDSLIQMEPRYKPFRRLVYASMRGYESQERAANSGYKSIKFSASNPKRNDDNYEVNDLENLLNLTDDSLARTKQMQKGDQ